MQKTADEIDDINQSQKSRVTYTFTLITYNLCNLKWHLRNKNVQEGRLHVTY